MKTLLATFALLSALNVQAAPTEPDYCRSDAILAAAATKGVRAEALIFTPNNPGKATSYQFDFEVTNFAIRPEAFAYGTTVTVTDKRTTVKEQIAGLWNTQTCADVSVN